MRGAWLIRAAGVAALAVLPGAAEAQQQNCSYDVQGQQNIVAPGTPNEVQYLGGGVTLLCGGGTRIRSDSMVIHRAMGIADLVGNVSFADTAKVLTASTARYYSRDRQLAAQGSEGQPVVLTDLRTGSIIRAPNMNYFQTDERIEIYSGRPVATLYRTPSGERVEGDTTVVTADGMTIRGEQAFEGRGNVVIERSGMDARAQQRAFFNQEAGILRLVGAAVAVMDSVTLRGDSILAYTEAAPPREGSLAGPGRAPGGERRLPGLAVPDTLTGADTLVAGVDTTAAADTAASAAADTTALAAAADTAGSVPVPLPPDPDAFREVLAMGAASLETTDITATGPRIVVLFGRGEVERLVVVGEPAVEGAEEAPGTPAEGGASRRAVARSETFVMMADSIDALAPGQALREVVAVGTARGVLRDTAAIDTVGVPLMARDNWIEGDTIRAFFAAAGGTEADDAQSVDAPLLEPPPEGGAAAGEERVVERLEAVGVPARSFFRQRSAGDDPTRPWDLSYLLAQRIVVRMSDGEVTAVDAQGEVKGIQLTPDAGAGVGRAGVGR